MALASSKQFFCRRFFASTFQVRNRIIGSICDLPSTRHFVSSDGLSNTTLMMQNGMDIQELPLVVKKITSNDASVLLLKNDSGQSTNNSINNSADSSSNNITNDELRDISCGFKNCSSMNELLKLLEVVPSVYVNSSIAIQVLEKMIELDRVYQPFDIHFYDHDDVSNNFTKTAVFNQLMNVIFTSNEPSSLLHCLILMNRNSQFKKNVIPYFDKLKDQILLLVTENRYKIAEVCSIINEFHAAGINADIDKMWIGITEQFANIDEKNILDVYRTLPYFEKSRSLIASTLQRKMTSLWWNVAGNDIAEILVISKETNSSSYKLLQVFARWLNTKIHSVSEDELLEVLKGFQALGYTNSQIITALERYIKMKGMAIINHSLFSTIMEYCMHFRIRSIPILSKCCDYFIRNGEQMSPSVLPSIIVPFGYLNYNPDRSYEYWKLLEETLRTKFVQFHPEHVVDILLSCVYLEKLPINFINHVFNPFFLTKLQKTCASWEIVKTKVKLIDQTLTLECASYPGPLLYKDFRSLHNQMDERIRFLVNSIKDFLITIAGSEENLHLFRYARSKTSIKYALAIDVLITPPLDALPKKNPPTDVALLIHVPEHYVLDENRLIGPQILRRRLLEKLGYKVVDLNYLELLKLRNYENLFIRRIKQCIEECSIVN